MRFETLGQLADTLKGVVKIAGGGVTILSLPPIRDGLVDLLADAALQGARAELRATARWLIKKLAPQMGAMLRAGCPDRSNDFRRVTVPRSAKRSYPFLRDLFRHFPGEGESGFEAIGEDLASTGAQAGIDAVAVAAAIQEGFCGDLYRPALSDAPWQLFAVRSPAVINVSAVEKTLWEELLSAQAERTLGIAAGSPTDVE